MQASVVLGNDAQPRSAPDARKSGARWRLRTMARTFRAAPSGEAGADGRPRWQARGSSRRSSAAPVNQQ